MLNILRGQNDGASLLMEIVIFLNFCQRRKKTEES